jgi:hypothetical protein
MSWKAFWLGTLEAVVWLNAVSLVCVGVLMLQGKLA